MSEIKGRLPKTVDELKEHFPSRIPKEFTEAVHVNARMHFLFFMDKQDRGKAGCTNCRRRVLIRDDLSLYKHNMFARCPKCGVPVQVKHMWRGYSRLHQSVLSYHFMQSQKDDDAIVCMAVYTDYKYDTVAPWAEKPWQKIDGYYVFIPGEGSIYAAPERKVYPDYSQYGYINFGQYYKSNKIKIRKSVTLRERVYHKQYGYELKVDTWETPDDEMAALMEGTSLRYVWQTYMAELGGIQEGDKYIRMLEYMCKYPLQLEYLGKIGLSETIYTSIDRGWGIGNVFNMRGDTLDKITKYKLTKEDKKYLMSIPNRPRAYVSLEGFKRWQLVRSTKGGSNVSLEEVNENLKVGYIKSLKALNYVEYGKLMRYLDKQHRYYPDFKQDIGMYWDYLEACMELGNDMEDKDTLWPQNLAQAHGNQKRIVKEKENEIHDRKYQKRIPWLKEKFSYEAMGFVIVIPDTISDFIREGKEMHNCVGNYIKRVAMRHTNVVYIRRVEAMDESFGTMEIGNDMRIIQARGKFNKELPEDARAFVEAFRENVLAKEVSA